MIPGRQGSVGGERQGRGKALTCAHPLRASAQPRASHGGPATRGCRRRGGHADGGSSLAELAATSACEGGREAMRRQWKRWLGARRQEEAETEAAAGAPWVAMASAHPGARQRQGWASER